MPWTIDAIIPSDVTNGGNRLHPFSGHVPAVPTSLTFTSGTAMHRTEAVWLADVEPHPCITLDRRRGAVHSRQLTRSS
jgi:hypothetical protein